MRSIKSRPERWAKWFSGGFMASFLRVAPATRNGGGRVCGPPSRDGWRLYGLPSWRKGGSGGIPGQGRLACFAECWPPLDLRRAPVLYGEPLAKLCRMAEKNAVPLWSFDLLQASSIAPASPVLQTSFISLTPRPLSLAAAFWRFLPRSRRRDAREHAKPLYRLETRRNRAGWASRNAPRGRER